MRPDLPQFCKNKRICAAVSGGGDSVALLHVLRVEAEQAGFSLSAVNVEHGIRGESSRADTAFVRELCARWHIPLYCFSEDIPRLAQERGVGLEEAARAARYRIFLRLLAEDKADFIATAHHAGDNAESVLFNLFRGSSLTGAGGIRPFVPAEEIAAAMLPETHPKVAEALRGKGIFRPLLGVAKAEILAYLRENALEWREDESNSDTAYTRNFLRKEVLAPARERFPSLDRAVYHFSRAAREDDEYLYSLARRYFCGGEVCFVSEEAPRPLFMRACVLALRHLGAERDYSAQNLSDLCALREGENGGAVHLPRGIVARREYGRISFFRPAAGGPHCEYPFGAGEFSFGEYRVRIVRGRAEDAQCAGRILYFDGARLPEGCVLRTRKAGDVFRKFGSGTKKLKGFFIDKKIPQRVRGEIPLLACGGEVLAVCGTEISEKIKVGEHADVYTIILLEKGE